MPLIFVAPGFNKNLQPINNPVELVDLYPTVMDLVGMKTPKFVSGKSLAPYFSNKKNSVRRNALTELQANIGGQKAQGYGIRTERYRLNRWFFNGSYQYELYDHKYDSSELYNLSKSKAYLDIRDSLSYVLSERVSEARNPMVLEGKSLVQSRLMTPSEFTLKKNKPARLNLSSY